MSGKYDLTQAINISWKWDEEPIPRDSNFLVQRDAETKDIEIFIDKFEADMVGSAEINILNALLQYYISISREIGNELIVKVKNRAVSEKILNQLGFIEVETGEIWKKGYRVAKLKIFKLKT